MELQKEHAHNKNTKPRFVTIMVGGNPYHLSGDIVQFIVSFTHPRQWAHLALVCKAFCRAIRSLKYSTQYRFYVDVDYKEPYVVNYDATFHNSDKGVVYFPNHTTYSKIKLPTKKKIVAITQLGSQPIHHMAPYLTCDVNNRLKLFDISDVANNDDFATSVCTYDGHQEILTTAISLGKMIVSADRGGHIHVWHPVKISSDFQNGSNIQSKRWHMFRQKKTNGLKDNVMSSKRKSASKRSRDKQSEEVVTLQHYQEHTAPILAIDSINRHEFITGDTDGVIKFWDTDCAASTKKISCEHQLHALRVISEEKFLSLALKRYSDVFVTVYVNHIATKTYTFEHVARIFYFCFASEVRFINEHKIVGFEVCSDDKAKLGVLEDFDTDEPKLTGIPPHHTAHENRLHFFSRSGYYANAEKLPDYQLVTICKEPATFGLLN